MKNFKHGCLKTQQRLVKDVNQSERQRMKISQIIWLTMVVCVCSQNTEKQLLLLSFMMLHFLINFFVSIFLIAVNNKSQFGTNLIRHHRRPLRSQHPINTYFSLQEIFSL